MKKYKWLFLIVLFPFIIEVINFAVIKSKLISCEILKNSTFVKDILTYYASAGSILGVYITVEEERKRDLELRKEERKRDREMRYRANKARLVLKIEPVDIEYCKMTVETNKKIYSLYLFDEFVCESLEANEKIELYVSFDLCKYDVDKLKKDFKNKSQKYINLTGSDAEPDSENNMPKCVQLLYDDADDNSWDNRFLCIKSSGEYYYELKSNDII
ncbi:MAG: hypothetical protein SPL89_02805 [Clostridia bacterium]|nr:hypothetical protein [Clostridia bacterium]